MGAREPERIAKIGPIELWGQRRQTPNEFTEYADAWREFIESMARELGVLRLADWLARKLEPRRRGES
jgi:hypothetical protein